MKLLSVEELSYEPDSLLLFERVRPMGMAVLLDSASPYSSQGRHDIISAAPIETIKEETTKENQLKSINYADNLNYFGKLKKALKSIDGTLDNPLKLPFIGGAIGYFGYDLCRQLESIPNSTQNDSTLPQAITGIYTWAIINDHHLKKTYLMIHPQTPMTLSKDIKRRLNQQANPITPPFQLKQDFKASIDQEAYETAFKRVKAYIDAGDCYQINLAQRFTSNYTGDSFEAYKKLRSVTAAPFSAFLDYGNSSILCLSPERFLHTKQHHVSTSPIKGTSKRSSCHKEDEILKNKLLNSDKDHAENLMIVDLLRNDLGKSCAPGSIKVEKLFELQSFETVHHLVSTITGTLNQGVEPIDLLERCFPGGSITGAPKVRAMEIIEELEDYRRSAYCGSLGYISCDGQMDCNITIRTLSCHNGTITCWAGGGIVADSNCESEYQECFSKVGKILETLEIR